MPHALIWLGILTFLALVFYALAEWVADKDLDPMSERWRLDEWDRRPEDE